MYIEYLLYGIQRRWESDGEDAVSTTEYIHLSRVSDNGTAWMAWESSFVSCLLYSMETECRRWTGLMSALFLRGFWFTMSLGGLVSLMFNQLIV